MKKYIIEQRDVVDIHDKYKDAQILVLDGLQLLKNLQPLKKCPELIELTITNCKIPSLEGLENCKKLEKLTVRKCKDFTEE